MAYYGRYKKHVHIASKKGIPLTSLESKKGCCCCCCCYCCCCCCCCFFVVVVVVVVFVVVVVVAAVVVVAVVGGEGGGYRVVRELSSILIRVEIERKRCVLSYPYREVTSVTL